MTPTPEALAQQAIALVDRWIKDARIMRVPERSVLIAMIAAALTEQAREIERATWEAAAKRFGACANIARDREEDVDSPGYWAREGAYRAYKHVEAACLEDARAAAQGGTR